MLFVKFNKLIRNKFVWTIFSGIIIVSFVAIYTPNQGNTRVRIDAGSINGVSVTGNEINAARWEIKTFRNSRQETTEVELREQTWRRLTALRFAKDLGLTVSKPELRKSITTLFTDETGRFNLSSYTNTAVYVTGRRNSEQAQAEFGAALAHDGLVRKVQQGLATSAWLPPSEARELARMRSDRFTIVYADVSTNDLPEPVVVTKTDVADFFEANIDDYEVAETRNIAYVFYDKEQYRSPTLPNYEAVEDYYTRNIDNYSRYDQNDQEVVSPLTNVYEEVETDLLDDQALDNAVRWASRFYELMIADYDGNSMPFNKAAEQKGVTVQTTGFFTESGSIDDADLPYEFNTAAFALTPSSVDKSFSDPLKTDKGIYVLSVLDIKEPYLPKLDSVEEDVRTDAERKIRSEKLEAHANTLIATLKKALKAGTAATNAFSEAKLETQSPDPFLLISPPQEFQYLPGFYRAVAQRQTGEFTDSIPTILGEQRIVYVQERRTSAAGPSPEALREVSEQQISSLGYMIFDSWQDYIKKAWDRKDNNPIVEKSEEVDEDVEKTS